MISPLKAPGPGLRFQLLASLLLALGTVSEGKKLKCFECAGDDQVSCYKGEKHLAKICDPGHVCYKEAGDKKSGKGCEKDNGIFKCIRELFGSCISPKTQEDADEVDAKILDCLSTKFPETNFRKLGKMSENDQNSLCFCDTHLCNPAGHLTSPGFGLMTSSMILSAVTAVYSYSRGAGAT